jgi:metal-responsive CopG/Arc/MetJ family transcriptional regulator
MARTTILLQDDLLIEVKRLAHTKGTTVTEVIQTALRDYVDTQPHAGLPSFTAVGRAKGAASKNLSRQAKKIARRAVDPYEGSPRGRR